MVAGASAVPFGGGAGFRWVSLEQSTVLFRDPTNAGRRFIPLLLADCELPNSLRRYKYVDFRNDSDEAFNCIHHINTRGEPGRESLRLDVITRGRQPSCEEVADRVAGSSGSGYGKARL